MNMNLLSNLFSFALLEVWKHFLVVLTICYFLQINVLKDNILIYNLGEMLSVVYRMKQMSISVKHRPNSKIRETDIAVVSMFYFKLSLLFSEL